VKSHAFNENSLHYDNEAPVPVLTKFQLEFACVDWHVSFFSPAKISARVRYFKKSVTEYSILYDQIWASRDHTGNKFIFKKIT
jgi:hypothetical protein